MFVEAVLQTVKIFLIGLIPTILIPTHATIMISWKHAMKMVGNILILDILRHLVVVFAVSVEGNFFERKTSKSFLTILFVGRWGHC